MLTDHGAAPDFARLRKTLTGEGAWRRPPLFDFHVDIAHKSRWLGRPIETGGDDVAFWAAAGYDYAQSNLAVPVPELQAAMAAERKVSGSDSVGSHRKIIESLDQYRGRDWAWQAVAAGDFSSMSDRFDWAEQQAAALPDNMKLLIHVADAFTFAWEMIGFDELCLASLDDPGFVDAVMGDIGAAAERIVTESIARFGDRVGAILYSDDIAYTEGLMLGPAFFRRSLFPLIGRLVKLGESVGAPLIYHSDGKLYDVLDDLIDAGIKGIQPLEPKSMDPLEIKRRWPGRVCLIGNVDLDLMSRGEPDAVEAHVRERIDRLNVGGGYIVGVSNTVPHYVRFENYQRMIATVAGYPDVPID